MKTLSGLPVLPGMVLVQSLVFNEPNQVHPTEPKKRRGKSRTAQGHYKFFRLIYSHYNNNTERRYVFRECNVILKAELHDFGEAELDFFSKILDAQIL